jgi:site-specific recombinase XerD
MLRHACGYALANAGHDTRALQAYLGHKNIQYTVRYTELAPESVQGFLALTIGHGPAPLHRGQNPLRCHA